MHNDDIIYNIIPDPGYKNSVLLEIPNPAHGPGKRSLRFSYKQAVRSQPYRCQAILQSSCMNRLQAQACSQSAH
jgi:hypothetical protein